MDILKIHRLLRRMSQYPNLTGLMRSIFVDVLDQRGIVSRDALAARVQEEMRKDTVADTEASRQEYLEALIDDTSPIPSARATLRTMSISPARRTMPRR